MALNIIKELKQLRECKKALEAMTELYDEKKKHLQRAVRRMSCLEEKNRELHEANLVLVGQLKQQNSVMEYLAKQNADLLLASRAKAVVPPTISVTEVRINGKAENSNSRA